MDADRASANPNAREHAQLSHEPSTPDAVTFNRVIGSGLSRTGTRSLYALLIRHGWPTWHYPFDTHTQAALQQGDVRNLLPGMSIMDLPSAVHFEQLAGSDPDTLVVHTTRHRDDWVPAVHQHYQRLLDDWHALPARFIEFSEWISAEIYGAFPPTVEGIAEAGDRQSQRVDDWHRQHPGRLLVVNVFTGEGIDLLGQRLMGRSSGAFAVPHITDDDEVPVSWGRAERTLLWEEERNSRAAHGS